jgi:hypothetical protein
MINRTDDYIANTNDTVVISPVYSQNKTNELKIMRNKNKKVDFCYINGIYIVMAGLLTALIALCILLYLHAIGRYNFITKQNRENFEK